MPGGRRAQALRRGRICRFLAFRECLCGGRAAKVSRVEESLQELFLVRFVCLDCVCRNMCTSGVPVGCGKPFAKGEVLVRQ